jgi:peptidoglycan/xylan/chitin deacetylase (PgdA/CDA1 family)
MNDTDPLNQKWVSLCYHDVRPSVSVAGGGPDRFAVPLAMFERMLEVIAREGFHGCSLEQAMLRGGQRRVAITFDDATAGQFDYAVPALRKHGMTATIYVVTDWVGRPGFMTWDQLRQVRDWGMSVQSHSRSHPFLSQLDVHQLTRELVESKSRLDEELQQATTEIAFPGGDMPHPSLRPLLFDLGYQTAVGSRWGYNLDRRDPREFVKRCSAKGDISVEMARRTIHADAMLHAQHLIRESALRGLRSAIGAGRYARIRRRVLDALNRAR